MRVRCIQREFDGVEYDFMPGAEYEVLAVEGGGYRLIDDTGRPYLFPSELFRVVDAAWGADWIDRSSDGVLYASPPEFARAGFFEDYFDRDPETIAVFHRYINRHLRLTDAA
jgi:hypothetical protein